MHDAIANIRQRTWDFALTVATVVLLGSLGVQSFLGTAYTWWAERTILGWEQTGYNTFVQVMNAIAAPQVVLLVVAMGLCVPKRLFARQPLLAVSALMVAIGAAAWVATGSMATGLAVYLVLAALIQVGVVVLTVAGTRSPSYLTEGRLAKTGSGLLHLGFIVACFVVVALQRSRFMMPVFVFASTAILVGTALSFWAGRLAYGRARAKHEHLLPVEVAAEPGPDIQPPADAATAMATEQENTDAALDLPDHGADEGSSEFDELG